MNREQKIAVLAAAADACPDPERKAKYLARKHVLIQAATPEERELENIRAELKNKRKAYEAIKNNKNISDEQKEKLKKQIDELENKNFFRSAKVAEKAVNMPARQKYYETLKRQRRETNDPEKVREIDKKMAALRKYGNSEENHSPEKRLAKHKERERDTGTGHNSHPGCNQYEHKPGCPRDKD